MQKSELWLVGVNEEYCWQHIPGNWDCIPCRVAVTMPEFFTALVAILDEALACHELLPSKVQQFEITDMPSGGVWVDLDEEYYAWVVLMRNGELGYSVNGLFSAVELA